MVRRLAIALATVAALSLAACASPTAPAAQSAHLCGGGVQAGSGGC